MTSPSSASAFLIGALKILRIVYALLLLPAAYGALLLLFLFIVATERRPLDWAYLVHHTLVLASMVAAIMLTGPLIRKARPKQAMTLYLVPVSLVVGLLFYESMK
jgi:hypothetical protein